MAEVIVILFLAADSILSLMDMNVLTQDLLKELYILMFIPIIIIQIWVSKLNHISKSLAFTSKWIGLHNISKSLASTSFY